MFKRMFETATATACPEATGTAPSEHANSMDLDLSATESDSTKPGQAQPVKSTHSGPSYPDIATAASGELEAKWKWSILKDTWTDCHMFNFPSRSIHGKMRKLSSSWLTDHPWLRYSISTDALFCAPCFVFGRKDAKEKTFISTPVKDWSNLAKYVKRHELAESNHHNVTAMAEHFLDIQSGKMEPITSSVSDSHRRLVEQNRHILRKIIEVIVLCGKQNIAIRGNTEERSNFLAILHSKAADDPILAQHLNVPENRRATYTSPDIQNELICLCAEQIQIEIVQACNDAVCFALIADESTDKSTKEQVSVCLRFVQRGSGSQQFRVREDFLGFVQASRTTGEVLAELLLTSLENHGIEVDKMRSQAYDGAANMSGKHRGVQARIRQRVPSALYVHCRAHCLNLAVMHSSKDPCIRWTSRADALSTFKSAYSVVVHALEQLQEDGDDKAGQHLASIMKFDFIIGLVVAEHVMQSTVPLSYLLQAVDCDLLEATRESQTLIRQFQNERADPNVWEALFQSAKDIAAEFEIEPSMPRLAQRQRNRANPPANDPQQYWQRALYFPFLDHLCQELSDRLIVAEERFRAQYLIPSKLNLCTDGMVDLIFAGYSVDLPQGNQSFHNEVRRWKARWQLMDENDKPSTLGETVASTNPDLYKGVYTVLTILLTMPASSATAERSFSVMRRVKTYLRSTMRTERMTGLALMHVYRDVNIDIDQKSPVWSEFRAHSSAASAELCFDGPETAPFRTGSNIEALQDGSQDSCRIDADSFYNPGLSVTSTTVIGGFITLL
ncbi:zinc finger MYM-type protein 1-like [Mya arenaria]|uniref:zinc finger MYM-type protein 1-like n=1 Tax=Mya arenaria TaxID=6604 RepID=UPI0022E15C3D|nr:zinc finger MYM-type protein 1-like [Mya arenaria]